LCIAAIAGAVSIPFTSAQALMGSMGRRWSLRRMGRLFPGAGGLRRATRHRQRLPPDQQNPPAANNPMWHTGDPAQ
jgi:hypothetical protein